MKNAFPVLIILMLLILIVTLFPPYSWGNEKLRTLSERNLLSFNYAYNLPIKEYDFIFNPVKKNFQIDNNSISLERHIILSELILEYILCLALSTILYFLFLRFKFKTISLFLYLLLSSIIITLWSYKINDILLIFRPGYEKVLNKEYEIKNKYNEYIKGRTVYDFLNKFRNIYNNNYVLDDWNDDVWEKTKDKISIPQNLLPEINQFITVKEKPSYIQTRNKYSRQKIRNPIDWGDFFDERVQKYYPDFSLPKGKQINSAALYNSIDKIKLEYFLNSLKNDFDYFKIRDDYFDSLNSFWAIVTNINYYGRYILVLFSLLFLLLKREFIINKSAIFLEKLFFEQDKVLQ